jgi:hypothetical protein
MVVFVAAMRFIDLNGNYSRIIFIGLLVKDLPRILSSNHLKYFALSSLSESFLSSLVSQISGICTSSLFRLIMKIYSGMEFAPQIPAYIKKRPKRVFFLYATSPRGIAFQSQTSCLLLPGRLRAPRRIHAPACFVTRLRLDHFQERSGSIPLKPFSAWNLLRKSQRI